MFSRRKENIQEWIGLFEKPLTISEYIMCYKTLFTSLSRIVFKYNICPTLLFLEITQQNELHQMKQIENVYARSFGQCQMSFSRLELCENRYA